MKNPLSNTDDLININWDTMNSTVGPLDDTYIVSTGSTTNSIYVSDTTWSTPTWSIHPSTSDKLHVAGDATIEGELVVQGVKLSERLDKIEERLAILHPNEELEEKWENLRGLRRMYMELEAELKEKESVWSILKK